MPSGISALLWWLLPLLAAVGAWYLQHRRAKIDPNADIAAGVNELNRFRKVLGETNPPAQAQPDDSE